MNSQSQEPQYPMYLVVAYNNLVELEDEYRRTQNPILLTEALYISCDALKRLIDDEAFWESLRVSADGDVAEEYPLPELRQLDVEDFYRRESELLIRAAVRTKSVDRLIGKAQEAQSRMQEREQPRFLRRFRKRIGKLRMEACERHRELLEANGFPKDVYSQRGRIITVRCFYVIGGVVMVGADVFGASVIPGGATLAEHSVITGLEIADHGLTAPPEELAA